MIPSILSIYGCRSTSFGMMAAAVSVMAMDFDELELLLESDSPCEFR